MDNTTTERIFHQLKKNGIKAKSFGSSNGKRSHIDFSLTHIQETNLVSPHQLKGEKISKMLNNNQFYSIIINDLNISIII